MPSATPPLCPVAGEMSPEDLKALLTEIGATPESLERDAAALREWVISQPHLPDLTGRHFILRTNAYCRTRQLIVIVGNKYFSRIR